MTRVEAHFVLFFGTGIAYAPLCTPAFRLPGRVHGEVPGIMVEIALAGGHCQILVQRLSGVNLRANIQMANRAQLGK